MCGLTIAIFIASSARELQDGPLRVWGFWCHGPLHSGFHGRSTLFLQRTNQGDGDWMGNLEWSLPTNFGSDDYFYIEDNIINGYTTCGAAFMAPGFSMALRLQRWSCDSTLSPKPCLARLMPLAIRPMTGDCDPRKSTAIR